MILFLVDHFMKIACKGLKVLLAFAKLITHTWQKVGMSVAITDRDRLSPSSVVVSVQGIGMFIPALVEMCVTSH